MSQQAQIAILRAAKPTPLVLRGSAERPWPVRLLPGVSSPATPAPDYWHTGPTDAPFDFCGHIRRLAADVALRCEELRHIDVNRVLFAVTHARGRHGHGLQARVTPLRFAGGRLQRVRRGVTYQVQRFFDGDTEYLYVLAFCLPRFLQQDFDSKFVTLFHELYHIGPAFDGDLRRHKGRYAVHSHSQRAYDRHMADLARAYLATRPDPDLHAFLRLDFGQLVQRHRAVAGIRVPRPKIVPVVLPQTPTTRY